MKIAATERRLSLKPVTLQPGQALETPEFVSFDVARDQFAFPAEGSYKLKATHFFDTQDLSKKIESNVVEIPVGWPTGKDQEALKFILDNKTYTPFAQLGLAALCEERPDLPACKPPNRPQACPGGWIVNVNTVCGMITNVAAGAPNSTVTTNQFLEDFNQYENGLLRLGPPPPARQFKVVGNTAGANATVTVLNDPAGAPPNNVPFDLHDDDDDTILPRLPDLGWMQDSDNPQQNLFAMAYVRPTSSTISQQNVAFALNIDSTNDSIKQQLNRGRYLAAWNSNQPDFWVAYVQAAFQAGINQDGDPDWPEENIYLGICLGTCIRGGDNGALLFQEAITDWQRIAARILQRQPRPRQPRPRQDFERGVTVHEIGHQFACLDVISTDDNIMGRRWLLSDATVTIRFYDPCLNLIRSVQRPGR